MANNKSPKDQRYDIHERIFNFVIKIIAFTKILPKTYENIISINQILRSSSSMGANDQETDGSSTLKDFMHCYTLVRKEAKETLYWLRLIERTNPKIKVKIEPLVAEANELVAIVSKIIINSSKKKLD